MQHTFIIVLTVLYGIAGVATFFGYIPTIIDLLHRKPSANVQTYLNWTLCCIVAFVYGAVVLRDAMFLLVMGLQLLACAAILVLRLRLKRLTAQRSAAR